MIAWILGHPGPVRVSIVASVLLLLLAWQRLRPVRGDSAIPWRRWRNVAMVVTASAVAYLLVPVTTVALAATTAALGVGLFNQFRLPLALELVAGVVLLDLAIYWQHRLFHMLPWLWRIHRVHHSDVGFDATLGLRFHPAEIVLSLFYKLALVVVLGLSPWTVLLYEILLASFALITHADVTLPPRWETRVRRVLVTPDWHRVHHSVHGQETDSNYGNILSVWDRIFATHVPQPRDGHTGMTIGLPGFREPAAQTLFALLRQPLRNRPAASSTR